MPNAFTTHHFTVRRHVPNTPDALHCTQAALVMALEALRHPETFTLERADQVTGFRAGVETWPYTMLAWLGGNGYEVRHEDALDALALMRDPAAELRRSGLDRETMQYFFEISDFERESRAIASCLRSGNVTFVPSAPDTDRLRGMLEDGWLPILSLDAAVLANRSRNGFEGHVVLLTGLRDGDAVIQDPGPPERWDWHVPLERISRSLRSPADTSGTITYVRPQNSRGA